MRRGGSVINMKNLTFTNLFAFLLLLAMPAFGQTILGNTTLSTAIGSSSVKVLTVASATGITAPSTSDGTKLTYLWIDKEALEVQAVSGTTITVTRGVNSTGATTHASGAFVFVIPAFKATYFGFIPTGSCTRANELLLPRIHFASGIISDCLGGQWIQGDSQQTTRKLDNLKRFPDPGASALTGLETAGTAAGAATEIYCTEIEVPYSMILTGLAVLNGTTVGTNKHFAILYDATGNVLANSATAGTLTAVASVYQKLNFTSPFYAVGPARYFGCDGLNGTTDTIRHAITAVNDNVLGGTITGQTFGTAAAITVPSSFTTAKVPYLALF
jgi:hypothetical protein